MGGQGQPQILAQVLLAAVDGAAPESAVAAPRAIVGRQVDGGTADSVTVESGIRTAARSSISRAGLVPIDVAAHSETLGQTNVVFTDSDGSMTAASDPRSDGAAVVAHYPRFVKP
jgi:gamma-glutamyltranspeptidase/glutathione hydrolase